MDTYSFLRELADSYVLAILFAIFVGVIFWAFRPGSRALHDDAANAVFRHDTPPRAAGCARTCPDCSCAGHDFTREPADVR